MHPEQCVGQTEIDVARCAYDALGRRIKKVDAVASPSRTYYYTYNDQWQVLVEEEVGQTYPRCYVYGNYVDEVVARFSTATGMPVYFIQDHLYSTTAIVNALGTILERYEYDAYGKVTLWDTYPLRED